LLEGELGIEIDTGAIKAGNGVNLWRDLPYTNHALNSLDTPSSILPPSVDAVNAALAALPTSGSNGYTGSAGDGGGPAGYTGSFGRTGYMGSLGRTGYVGSSGRTGYIGSASTEKGYTGSSGFSGSLGYSGSRGYTGSRGDLGPSGYTGSASTVSGPIGGYGPKGYTGSFGIKGYTGSAIAGYVGSRGAQGPAGGYTGSIGNFGYTGSAANDGYVGSVGLTGYTGSTGIGLDTVNVFTKNQSVGMVSLLDTSTVLIDASLSNNFELQATAEVGATRTLGNPSNATSGMVLNLWIYQDGTGGQDITWDTNYKFAGGTPYAATTSSHAVDFYSLAYSATKGIWVVAQQKGIA
jgi:hypothetical protein